MRSLRLLMLAGLVAGACGLAPPPATACELTSFSASGASGGAVRPGDSVTFSIHAISTEASPGASPYVIDAGGVVTASGTAAPDPGGEWTGSGSFPMPSLGAFQGTVTVAVHLTDSGAYIPYRVSYDGTAPAAAPTASAPAATATPSATPPAHAESQSAPARRPVRPAAGGKPAHTAPRTPVRHTQPSRTRSRPHSRTTARTPAVHQAPVPAPPAAEPADRPLTASASRAANPPLPPSTSRAAVAPKPRPAHVGRTHHQTVHRRATPRAPERALVAPPSLLHADAARRVEPTAAASGPPLILGALALVLVLGGAGGAVVLLRRRRRQPPPADPVEAELQQLLVEERLRLESGDSHPRAPT